MAGAPNQPVPQKNPTLWWVLATFGAVCAVLLVLALAVGIYFVRYVRVKESAKQVSISSPVGNLKISEGEQGNTTGLPAYPGATVSQSGATVEVEPPNEKAGTRIGVAEYVTSDPLEKVQAWYREQLGPEFTQEKHGRVAKVAGRDLGDADVAFVAEKEGWVRVVALKHSGEGVSIALLRVNRNEPQ